MASNDKATEVLTSLGLTVSQARVYFAISRSGVSPVKTISKIAHVAREHVYEVLPQLQDLGLVEKIIDVPIKFQALPIREGLSLLLQHRVRKTNELQEQATELIRSCQNNNLEIVSKEEDKQFILIPRKKAAISRRRKQIETAKTSIDALISFTRLEPTAYTYYEAVEEALERGVKIRLISEKPEINNEIPEVIQDWRKNPFFELRFIINPPLAVVTIYDRKEMLVTTSAQKSLGQSHAFWSKNPSLLAMVNDFYEMVWITALETPYYSTDDEQI